MSFTVERLTKNSRDIDAVKRLIENAFPPQERVSTDFVLDFDKVRTEFLLFYDGDLFCGFACLLNGAQDISFFCWLAVEENLRGKGYGGKILQYIREQKRGRRIFFDIERVDVPAENSEQRLKRKKFYLRNGYHETGLYRTFHGVDYELLVNGGEISAEDVDGFFAKILRAVKDHGAS
ncbi:MAG: GNAT family N-acetyltransferase [Selenomonadaceae bacterium]|nr:GNAT family N-acetyltransferase [Selenomonadaceae bacterium]